MQLGLRVAQVQRERQVQLVLLVQRVQHQQLLVLRAPRAPRAQLEVQDLLEIQFQVLRVTLVQLGQQALLERQVQHQQSRDQLVLLVLQGLQVQQEALGKLALRVP